MVRATLAATLVFAAAAAEANTSHAGWPQITGMLLMNKLDQDRPLDARPGYDPFGGTDPTYSCDGLHRSTYCGEPIGGHNELLGGHGDDWIHAGPEGDVIWGDYKPSGQPATQVDHLHGGPGRDFIYASHGRNVIITGGGRDVVHAHFGRGVISCGSERTIVYISRRSRPGYRLIGCKHISYKTIGY